MSEHEPDEMDYRDALHIATLDVLIGQVVELRDEHELLGVGKLVSVSAVYELHRMPTWVVRLDHGDNAIKRYERRGLVSLHTAEESAPFARERARLGRADAARVLTEEQIDAAVSHALFNNKNYPDWLQMKVLGRDMSPLRKAIVESVILAQIAAATATEESEER